MFLILLAVTLLTAMATSAVVIMFFRKPTLSIFIRIIGEDIAGAWHRFLLFALFVVGISSGVNLWKLERYITPAVPDIETPVLNADRWSFEIFRTVLSTLGGLAWALLVFFVIALIAFAIVKVKRVRSNSD